MVYELLGEDLFNIHGIFFYEFGRFFRALRDVCFIYIHLRVAYSKLWQKYGQAMA